MTPALLLVLEGLLLLASCVDLSRGYALLESSPRILLLVCAGIPPIIALWPWRRRAGLLRAPLLALAAGCLALGGFGLLENRGARLIRERWDASSRQRLEAQARAIEADFGSFLADLSRPLERGRAPFGNRRSAFVLAERVRSSSVLPQERLGSSIYRDDGSVVAWDGNSSEAPRTLLARPCPGPVYGIGGREASRRLYAVVCSGDSQVRTIRENGEQVRKFDGTSDYVYSAAVTPDGKVVVAGGQDSVLRVWNGTNAQIITTFIPPEAQ